MGLLKYTLSNKKSNYCDRRLRHFFAKTSVMAKSSTRRVTIYINGKKMKAFVKQMRAEIE